MQSHLPLSVPFGIAPVLRPLNGLLSEQTQQLHPTHAPWSLWSNVGGLRGSNVNPQLPVMQLQVLPDCWSRDSCGARLSHNQTPVISW